MNTDKRRTRLNILSHILEQIPYKDTPREKVVLPKRQKVGDYVETKYPFRFIPEKYLPATTSLPSVGLRRSIPGVIEQVLPDGRLSLRRLQQARLR